MRFLAAALLVWNAEAALRAGAAKVDVTPRRFPVASNCMFLERLADKAHAPLHARAIVLDDGAVKLAIVVVDSCMMPRDLIDRAKEIAARATGIPSERIMVSATHTHSAPAAMSCLGTDAEADYVEFLPRKIAEAISLAAARLVPARVGHGAIDDYEDTHCRRWILRPDKMKQDPFGFQTVRANMHPGYQNPDAIAPSGPVDPQLSVLSIHTTNGAPLALLANYSQHYFGSPILHPDYFGVFSETIGAKIGAGADFVAMMSQGTSGDQMWMDYGAPKSGITLEEYSARVVNKAVQAYRAIRHDERATLAMAETRLTLGRRVPDERRMAWADGILAGMGPKPRNQNEVYAREQRYLRDEPRRELKLQAIRVGGLGIAAMPNEVFAITGLKIKARSPLAATFNIELANGAEGYIPPPEQHRLGGYTTWPARSAGLEESAEPRIVDTLLGLLERTAGAKRREPAIAPGPYSRAVMRSRPQAYWRMNELAGTTAADSTGRHPATYTDGVAFYLPGAVDRAPHFAGGWLEAFVEASGAYTVEAWFWHGAPGIAGTIVAYGDELAIGADSRLRAGSLVGATRIEQKTWRHVALLRDRGRLRVYLDGSKTPEIDGAATAAVPRRFTAGDSFEGKIDEVAVYPRALSPAEVESHFRAAGSR